MLDRDTQEGEAPPVRLDLVTSHQLRDPTEISAQCTPNRCKWLKVSIYYSEIAKPHSDL